MIRLDHLRKSLASYTVDIESNKTLILNKLLGLTESDPNAAAASPSPGWTPSG